MKIAFLPNVVVAIVLATMGLWAWAALNLAISAIFAITDISSN